jgi:hypothetical protein
VSERDDLVEEVRGIPDEKSAILLDKVVLEVDDEQRFAGWDLWHIQGHPPSKHGGQAVFD